MATVRQVLEELRSIGDPDRLSGMARYGIATGRALGVSIPDLRTLARPLGRDHELAAGLWGSEIHEARILASMVDEPDRVTQDQMDAWALEFDSWDLCDQVCANLFDRTPYAFLKAVEWSWREEEFVRRAAFALMAASAVHNKTARDDEFEVLLPIIRRTAEDDRNYVKKAVNWALRQIGKRSPGLNRKAIETAKQIQKLDSSAARWIAADALRELTSEPVRKRLANR